MERALDGPPSPDKMPEEKKEIKKEFKGFSPPASPKQHKRNKTGGSALLDFVNNKSPLKKSN